MKKVILVVIIGLSIVASSCNKDEALTKDIISQITGTYSGSYTDDGGVKNDGAADITALSDSTLEIHCFDEDGFDTTFVMEFYGNGDSVMLCNTGDDFYTEYDHQMLGGAHHIWNTQPGHMMGKMSNGDWNNHLESNHNKNDKHYGGFNTNDHSFNYRLKLTDNAQFLKFLGFKVN